MKRIIVIGCPGSGKSTFSRALAERSGLPLHHLDMMFWNADRTTVERSVFLDRLEAVLGTDKWIIDGNYSSTMEMRLSLCDTVFFLDYPTEVSLDGVRQRRGKARIDIPWVETAEDGEFIEYIKRFNETEKPKIHALLNKYKERNVFVFTSREMADAFLVGNPYAPDREIAGKAK